MTSGESLLSHQRPRQHPEPEVKLPLSHSPSITPTTSPLLITISQSTPLEQRQGHHFENQVRKHPPHPLPCLHLLSVKLTVPALLANISWSSQSTTGSILPHKRPDKNPELDVRLPFLPVHGWQHNPGSSFYPCHYILVYTLQRKGISPLKNAKIAKKKINS